MLKVFELLITLLFFFSIKQLKILIVQFNFDSWNINIKFNPFHKSLFKEVKFVKKH